MTPRLAWLLLLASALAAAGEPARGLPAADDARLAALITEPRLDEISGLAASRRHRGILWVHNDSDDGAVVHAIDEHGELRASVELRGVANIDFEDMAAFELDGQPYLLIADTGDNGGLRRELRLHVFAEPAALVDATVDVGWTVRFQWPDGPRDCEAVAVDALHGDILLVSKKRVPPELFRLPLRADDMLHTAEPIGRLNGIVQPDADDLRRNPRFGRYRSQVSGADVSADGRALAVLTYLQAYVYRRGADEAWGTATVRAPQRLPFPWLAQAEAIAFDQAGSLVWISSEHLPAPLLRIPLPPPH